MTARRTVDDDLDNFGNYFYFYGYGALLHYDLERHIWYDFERQLGSHRRQAHTADRHCTVGSVQLADAPLVQPHRLELQVQLVQEFSSSVGKH